MGRLEEALAEMKRASELDPLNPLIRASEAYYLHMTGRTDEAVQCLRWLNELFPNAWMTSFSGCLVLFQQGLFEEARTFADRGLALDPANSFLHACLALIYGRQGKPADAMRILEQLERRVTTVYLSPTALYLACTACKDVERAYGCLEKAIDERDPLALMVLRPRLDSPDVQNRHRALRRRANLE